jgi:hypothetical protein
MRLTDADFVRAVQACLVMTAIFLLVCLVLPEVAG